MVIFSVWKVKACKESGCGRHKKTLEDLEIKSLQNAVFYFGKRFRRFRQKFILKFMKDTTSVSDTLTNCAGTSSVLKSPQPTLSFFALFYYLLTFETTISSVHHV